MTRTPQLLSQEQIANINNRANLPAYAPRLTLGLAFAALVIMFNTTFFVGVFIFVIGYFCISPVRNRDKARKITELTYDQENEHFAAIQGACQKLGEAHSVWYIETEQENLDRKRQAGADNLVARKQATVKPVEPPFISTNVVIWGIDIGELQVLFFPDAILVWQQGQYQKVAYESFGVVYYPTRFVEPSPPKDAEIAGYTWQYVNARGGPDRRFSNNSQIPVALYGLLVMTTPSGLKVQLHVSNRALGADFVTRLSNVLNLRNTRQRSGTKDKDAGSKRSGQTRNKSRRKRSTPSGGEQQRRVPANEVLNVPPGATKDQIVSGYRKMAQMYHPDKVSGLGPEFQELAEARMKEINSAYTELLKKTAG